MTTNSGKTLSKLGIGTWGIGGRGHRPSELTDVKQDGDYIRAVSYQLQKGMNFMEVSLGYGHGNSIKLLQEAIEESGVNRENLFITHSFYDIDLENMQTIKNDIISFHKILKTDYADSTLVTQGIILSYGKEVIYSLLHELLNSGKTRYVSLSNAGKHLIEEFKKEFGDKFHGHEGHVSFEIRVLEDEGIMNLCDSLGVRNILWRPLRKGMSDCQNWPILGELSARYNKNANQIILNWMTHVGYAPMVFSTNKEHVDENLAATEFTMTDEDYQTIAAARPVPVPVSKLDWDGEKLGKQILSLANDLKL